MRKTYVKHLQKCPASVFVYFTFTEVSSGCKNVAKHFSRFAESSLKIEGRP